MRRPREAEKVSAAESAAARVSAGGGGAAAAAAVVAGSGGGGAGWAAAAEEAAAVAAAAADVARTSTPSTTSRCSAGSTTDLASIAISYNGSDKAYVGVMAQEVQTVMPDAVVRGRDGYLRVYYDKLGLKFETYDHWVASGARIPSATGIRHTQIAILVRSS